MVDEAAACTDAKAEGNAAFAAGDLEKAAACYAEGLESWERLLASTPRPSALKVGDRVRYNRTGGKRFGMVMSAFPVMDEYFLKDLGTDEAIWQGEPGGQLKRFELADLQLVPEDVANLWLACTQNLSAVYLKQGELREAVTWADAALAANGKASKALLRKAAALLKMGPEQENSAALACEVLTAAKEADPKNREILKLMREAEIKRGGNWVCIMGCCGPWGIVCGGPVALEAVPEIGPGKIKTTFSQASPMVEAARLEIAKEAAMVTEDTELGDQNDKGSPDSDSDSDDSDWQECDQQGKRMRLKREVLKEGKPRQGNPRQQGVAAPGKPTPTRVEPRPGPTAACPVPFCARPACAPEAETPAQPPVEATELPRIPGDSTASQLPAKQVCPESRTLAISWRGWLPYAIAVSVLCAAMSGTWACGDVRQCFPSG